MSTTNELNGYSDVAIVVPAYNEEKTIVNVLEKIISHSPTIAIIVIDDGSKDKTADVIKGLPLTLLRNEKNLGKDASLLKGFDYALTLNKSAVITIDADGQHDPKYIPEFLQARQQFPEYIIMGARLLDREQAPKMRLRANQIADFFISWAAGEKIIDSQSGFRLYPSSLLKFCRQSYPHATKFVLESRILIDGARNGYGIAAIAIPSHYPADRRESHYRPFKDTLAIIRMVGWKLLSHGFCLKGLWNTLFTSAVVFKKPEQGS